MIPEFYTRNEGGLPTSWVKSMRESMARLTPRFSTNRTVHEYVEQHYLPAAEAYRLRAADGCVVGKQIVEWQQHLAQRWPLLHFGTVTLETDDKRHVFEAQVYLDDFDAEAVCVQLYADGIGGAEPERVVIKQVRQLVGAPGDTLIVWRAGHPPGDGLFGATHTPLRQRGDSAGGHEDPVAAVIRSLRRASREALADWPRKVLGFSPLPAQAHIALVPIRRYATAQTLTSAGGNR